MSQLALVKARDWESGWFTGVFVARRSDHGAAHVSAAPRALSGADAGDSGAYMKANVCSGNRSGARRPVAMGGRLGGYGERFASREGQFIAANSLAASGNGAEI